MDFNEEEELQEELGQIENLGFNGETQEQPNYDDENINESEPVEDPVSSDSENYEGPIDDVKAQMKKKALTALLKSPIFWGIVVFAVLIFIAVLIFHMDYDLYGVGEPRPEYYQTPACGKVYLTWEKESYTKAHSKDPDYEPITDPSLVDLSDEERFTYEEYEYDEFVAGVIWKDNKDALDVDNEIVYQAMAIAARSRLIAELPDNCVVLKEYNDQAKSFTELDGSEEKYSEITGAVQLSQGIIIGRNGEIIPALYDTFSYTKKRMGVDRENASKYFYHMMNANEQGEQVIPADWVDELEKEKGNKITTLVPNTKKLESMSLYGAKYLLEKTDSLYELYRILEEYYGRDIEYYTISYAFSNEYGYFSGCSPFSIKSTSLSREEFIRIAESYGNSHGGGAKILGDNAGMIYDMAVSNGINPELVFVRAKVEGYYPGASKNNYWGIGCVNGGGYKACHEYDSLSEGITGFFSTIAKYESLNDFYSYAFLGKYWFNPGNWGDGGCVYSNAMYGSNIPERVRDACAAGKSCIADSQGNGIGDCVPTTEEEQQKYLEFQIRSMTDARKEIFGLDPEECNVSCTIWKQGDERWGSINLGISKSTMKSSGCAVTSVAIAISCSGTQINDAQSFNPGTFVQRMNATGGFKGALIYWSNSAISYYAPNFKFSTTVDISGTVENKINRVQQYMDANTSLLLHFENKKHPRGHYTVLKAISGTSFIVYDPATGTENSYEAKDLDGLVIYKY